MLGRNEISRVSRFGKCASEAVLADPSEAMTLSRNKASSMPSEYVSEQSDRKTHYAQQLGLGLDVAIQPMLGSYA